jgi:hypothetical protein
MKEVFDSSGLSVSVEPPIKHLKPLSETELPFEPPIKNLKQVNNSESDLPF